MVEFSGSLTLSRAEELRERLIEALTLGQHLRLDCRGATEVDVSFLQLVIAARRSAAAHGISLTLANPADGPLLATLRRAGFVGEDNPETADGRLWTNERPDHA